MQDMYAEYSLSLSLVSQRIKELQAEKKNLTTRCNDCGDDVKKDPLIIELSERLSPLNRMKLELQEVAKEVLNYYKPDHWRNENLCMNARVIIHTYYAPDFYLDKEIFE